ncbi:MAG: DUF3048 domain-containing protein [Actinomycetota bacterium]|nr:DUF3048 domain-containing protein [Actinomycetota bacterium]
MTTLAIALALGSGACAGGGGSAQPVSIPVPSTAVPSTTSTTAATTSSTVPPTTQPTGPPAPLTGVPDGDTDLSRPALAVKIDNHRDARPPAGIEFADLVFESRAEGVTRFMAVFHSDTPEVLGPVRSSRTADFSLLAALDRPLYGSSGGNPAVLSGLRDQPVYALTAASESVYYRESSRRAPHNLFVDANDLFALGSEDATPPAPWFRYRNASDAVPGRAASGEIVVSFRNSPIVGLEWDPALEGWARSQDGDPHVTEAGARIAPANVVIMVAKYKRSSADPNSPELISTGEGDLFVLTAGSVVQGTWSRPDRSDKPTLTDENGAPILLTPGQTWILYPEAGSVTL